MITSEVALGIACFALGFSIAMAIVTAVTLRRLRRPPEPDDATPTRQSTERTRPRAGESMSISTADG